MSVFQSWKVSHISNPGSRAFGEDGVVGWSSVAGNDSQGSSRFLGLLNSSADFKSCTIYSWLCRARNQREAWVSAGGVGGC